MKARILLLAATALSGFLAKPVIAQQKYQMQPVTIQTRWAKEVSPGNALKEYPRPQMVRKQWTNLNGLWDYAITPKDSSVPLKAEGQILVPYPIESALSGVKKNLKPDQNLWYMRRITAPKLTGNQHVILHFGAVDYQATVYIDGIEVGKHEGGYTEFSVDITKFLTKKEHTLFIKVYDPSDQGVGPHGKQVLNPANIYYTPSSGIWQTVWTEIVSVDYIASLVLTPDIDKKVINVTVNSTSNLPIELNVEGNIIQGESNKQISVPIKDMKLWSPGNPYLYDLKVKLGKDEVKSYFGMRKISITKDQDGVDRIFLNNKPYFNLGVLDQGFWPDGLYTAPTDEALAFDIKAIKAMGFNTIRKHIKVEPARWYYHADKLGMIVWQDMVNPNQGLPDGSKTAFEAQAKETAKQLHNYPSITTWVLFNEKWGQYDQARLTKWLRESDSSRIVNGHSGELLYVNEKLRSPAPDAYVNSDMTDVHSYPNPMMSIKQENKAQVLGEFGGIGVFVDNHQWDPEAAWGYSQEKPAALKDKYAKLNEKLILLQKQGLSGSIYTQPFDVESEQNGLMTYDREVVKIPFAKMREIHAPLYSVTGVIPKVTAMDLDLTDPEVVYHKLLEQYKKEKKDKETVYRLILMGTAFNDKKNLKALKEDYIKSLKSPYSKDDFKKVMNLTRSTKDPGFNLIFKNSKKINELLGVNEADGKILALIDREIKTLIGDATSESEWDSAYKIIREKYMIFGEEAMHKAMLGIDYSKEDYQRLIPDFIKYAEFIKKNYGQNELNKRFGGNNVNNVAWIFFERTEDVGKLTLALDWMKDVVRDFPNYYQGIDTYANILYKLGNTKEAISWQKKAVALVPSAQSSVYKQALDKMEKGLKTWPDIK